MPLISSLPEMRRVISKLAGLLSAYATTTFLVGEYSEADISVYPEFAVADGIGMRISGSDGLSIFHATSPTSPWLPQMRSPQAIARLAGRVHGVVVQIGIVAPTRAGFFALTIGKRT